jgi:hypothetical protein
MSINLPPILHNGQLNQLINVSDFNYSQDYITYSIGDNRFVLSANYNYEILNIDNSF